MMRWTIVLAGILAASPARAGKVQMCVDESCASKVKREKLDCTIHKNKRKSLTLGFKLSLAFAAKAGPEVSFGKSAEINWNSLSQELIRRYEELCDMHNKGHLSVAKFNERYEKLESYFEKAKDLKVEIEDTVQARADKAFADLDREARKHSGDPETVAEAREKVSRINGEVEELAKDVKGFGSEDSEEAAEKPSGQKKNSAKR